MIDKMSKRKITYILLLILTILLFLNLRNIYEHLPQNFKKDFKSYSLKKYNELGDKTKIIFRTLNLDPFKSLNKRYYRENPSIKNLDNDYNVNFLPNTQFQKLETTIHKVNFNSNKKGNSQSSYGPFKPFYFEIYDNKILFINSFGETIKTNIKNLDQDINKIKYEQVSNNLKTKLVMGSLIDRDQIYVSYLLTKNNCQEYKISKAKINFENLIFEDFFVSKDCGKNLRAGAMIVINFQGNRGILASMGGEVLNKPTNKPQSDSSDIGKTLFINLENNEKIIFSKGHRNPQGLLKIDDENIISTEHGPYGGDELNRIIFGENYGWPIASYGSSYTKHRNKFKRESYKKSHEDYNFQEPIYSFVPSIGISKIIRLPDTFSKNWQDNFLLSSLNGGSLYRIKFDKSYKKILFMEKIFIGKRIRDLKYLENSNSLVLALEDFQEIMVLKATE